MSSSSKLSDWLDNGTALFPKVSTRNIQIGAGTLSLPAYSFLNDLDTGMYNYGSGILAFSGNGVLVGYMSSVKLATTGYFTNFNGVSVGLYGAGTDSAIQIGVKLCNENSLITAGSKITGFYSDAGITLKAYVDYLGNFYAPANKALIIGVENQAANTNAGVGMTLSADDGGTGTTGGAGGSFTLNAGNAKGTGINNGGNINLNFGAYTATGLPGKVNIKYNGILKGFFTVGGPTQDFLAIIGDMADGATAVALTVGSSTTYTTAGAKLFSVNK